MHSRSAVRAGSDVLADTVADADLKHPLVREAAAIVRRMGSSAQAALADTRQASAMEQNIKSHREIHQSLRTAPGSRSGICAAGIYLTVCGTLSIYSTLAFNGPDANLAGVIPYLVTAPWSLLPLGILDPDTSTTLSNIIFVGLPVIGALINTVIIHTAARKFSAVIHHYRLGTARVTHPAPATPEPSEVVNRTTVAH